MPLKEKRKRKPALQSDYQLRNKGSLNPELSLSKAFESAIKNVEELPSSLDLTMDNTSDVAVTKTGADTAPKTTVATSGASNTEVRTTSSLQTGSVREEERNVAQTREAKVMSETSPRQKTVPAGLSPRMMT